MRGYLIAVPLVAGVAVLAGASMRAQARTATDGVFTAAQAERGRALYRTSCGHCHRDDLTGGGSEEGAPPLIGPIFTSRWRDDALSEMFLTIGTTMPKNKPDSLTPQVVADIMSFLLVMNEKPAGTSELPADLEALKQIQFANK